MLQGPVKLPRGFLHLSKGQRKGYRGAEQATQGGEHLSKGQRKLLWGCYHSVEEAKQAADVFAGALEGAALKGVSMLWRRKGRCAEGLLIIRL